MDHYISQANFIAYPYSPLRISYKYLCKLFTADRQSQKYLQNVLFYLGIIFTL